MKKNVYVVPILLLAGFFFALGGFFILEKAQNSHFETKDKVQGEMKVGNSRTPSSVQTPSGYEDGVHLYQPDHGNQVTQDLSELDMPEDPLLTPSQKINLDLAKEQEQKAYNKAVKEEFVRRFIANAKRDGVELEVDENLEVIKVRQTRARDIQSTKSEDTSGSTAVK